MGTAAEIQVISMTEQEARATVKTIKADLESAGRLAIELRKREGWRALGYTSWSECATAEFGKSLSYINREIRAEEVRSFISANWHEETKENIPESVLRPLTEIRDQPELIPEAWGEAKGISNSRPTAEQVKRAVDTVLERHGLNDPRKPLPGQASFLDQPQPKQETSPYRLMQRCIGDVLRLLATVNAPDTPDQQGLGGIARVTEKLTEPERREIGNYVATLIESLQEWADALGVDA